MSCPYPVYLGIVGLLNNIPPFIFFHQVMLEYHEILVRILRSNPVYLGSDRLRNNDNNNNNFFFHVMIRIKLKTILVKQTYFVLSVIVPLYRFQRLESTDISVLHRTIG